MTDAARLKVNYGRAMSPRELARRIEHLRPFPPITASFERAVAARSTWNPDNVWYRSQKEHWLGWLSYYNGPGAYGRKVHRGRTAAFAYNHIVCAPILLWLAEASGLPKGSVLAAKRAALLAPSNLASMSAAIRHVIPFEIIEERLGLAR